MPRFRAVSGCLCSHHCGPSGRHFSFLMLLLCSSGHVTWSPAHNYTSVCGSVVARETFGKEARADGWQPFHVAWSYLMRCPWVSQTSDKLPSPHCRLGPEQQEEPLRAQLPLQPLCLHQGSPRPGWEDGPGQRSQPAPFLPHRRQSFHSHPPGDCHSRK